MLSVTWAFVPPIQMKAVYPPRTAVGVRLAVPFCPWQRTNLGYGKPYPYSRSEHGPVSRPSAAKHLLFLVENKQKRIPRSARDDIVRSRVANFKFTTYFQ